jgi:hypothetical protein
MLFLLALSSWEGWRIWKTQSHSTVKHSLCILLATQIVPFHSTTSPMLCLLASSNWAGWRIWKMQSHPAARHTFSMEDLEDAISYHREALSLRPPGHPNRSSSLNNLANVLSTRYEQSGRMEDLEEAINPTAKHSLLSSWPPRSFLFPQQPCNAIHTRYKQLGRMEDLEEAITYHREALTLCPPGHPNRSIFPQQPCQRFSYSL